MLEYISLGISGLLLIGLIVVLIIVLKDRNKKPEVDVDKEIKQNLELVEKNIALQMKDEFTKINEVNNEKLERFQTNINNSFNTRFDSLNKDFSDKMIELNCKVGEGIKEGFKTNNETLINVRERLKVIDEAQKNIEGLSKDVVSLKTVLEGNQSRGRFGEFQLQMVLHHIFGDTIGTYAEQYVIKKGRDQDGDVRADAVVFMPEPNKLICIDSKFPFKDYEKLFDDSNEDKEKLKSDFAAAVKKHITDISNKYIIPGKTAPQAFMFIPNDGIFAFIHHNLENVVSYAREKDVILSSPSTLPSFLITINMMRIEYERNKNFEEMSKQLDKLGKEFDNFSKDFTKFSNQLDTACKTKGELTKRAVRIHNNFNAISNVEMGQIEMTDEEEDI